MDKREGEYQDFPSKIFCLTLPKNFVGKDFSVSLISGIEKIWISDGGMSRFSVEGSLSHSSENIRRGILYCCNSFGYPKGLVKVVEYRDFPSKNFCLIVPKNFVGKPFCAVF